MKAVIKKALIVLMQKDEASDFKSGIAKVYDALTFGEVDELKALSLNEILRSTTVGDLINLGFQIEGQQNK